MALGIALAGLIGLVLTGLVVTGPGAASGAERGADAEALARGAAVARGAYVFRAAGCTGCHTDPKRKHEPLAGGPALETPFGTFYGPHISPDPEHGIGRWSDADFLRALREGLAPDGRHYYPVFPYPSYSGMTERDALDLKAYIFSLAPVARPNRPHEVSFPFEFGFLLGSWKALCFAPRRFAPDPARRRPVEPGRLSGRAPGPLRRVPHATRFPRRQGRGPQACRQPERAGRQESAQHHARSRGRHRPLARGRCDLLPEDRLPARRRP